MNDKIATGNPFEIKDNSKERVAYDLLEKIASYDSREKSEGMKREYWLTLYHQCLKATSGTYSIDSILNEK
jgi:hypothetical protein